MKTKRRLGVLDRRLAESHYLAGPNLTIADMGRVEPTDDFSTAEGRDRRREPKLIAIQSNPLGGRALISDIVRPAVCSLRAAATTASQISLSGPTNVPSRPTSTGQRI